jgi:hypothetical protein
MAFHSTGSCSNAPIQAGNLLTGKVKPSARLPQLRQLPPAAAAALRRRVADSPGCKAAEPLTTFVA